MTPTTTATTADKLGKSAAAEQAPIVALQPEDIEREASAPQSDAAPSAAAVAGPEAAPAAEPQVEHNRHAQELQRRDGVRERAAKRYQEMRNRERAEKEGRAQQPEPAAEPAPEPVTEAQPPERPAQPARSEQRSAAQARTEADGLREPAAAALPQKVVLKVDGRDEEVTLDEALSRARKYTAGEKRLDKAKDILRDAIQSATVIRGQTHPASAAPASAPESQPAVRAEREDAASPEPGHPQPEARPSASTESPPRRSKIDRDKLRQLAERIQVGDTDEGADALAELLETTVQAPDPQPRVSQDAVRQHVHEELRQAKAEAENAAALKAFADKYPALKDNDVLADAAVGVLRKEIIRDLQEVGGLSDADLAPLSRDINQLVFVHGRARQAGLQVATPAQLLDRTGQYMAREFGLQRAEEPAPAQRQPHTQQPHGASSDPALQSRIEAKRGAQQQPRAAGVRAAPPQAPRPRTAQEIVRDMKRQRGFPVHS
jgi:hypothetical protein